MIIYRFISKGRLLHYIEKQSEDYLNESQRDRLRSDIHSMPYLSVNSDDIKEQYNCGICGKSIEVSQYMYPTIDFITINDTPKLRTCMCNECRNALREFMKQREDYCVLSTEDANERDDNQKEAEEENNNE